MVFMMQASKLFRHFVCGTIGAHTHAKKSSLTVFEVWLEWVNHASTRVSS